MSVISLRNSNFKILKQLESSSRQKARDFKFVLVVIRFHSRCCYSTLRRYPPPPPRERLHEHEPKTQLTLQANFKYNFTNVLRLN